MAKQKNSGVPKWVWVFTSILALLFIGMLWLLSTVDPATPPSQAWQATKKEVKSAIKNNKKPSQENESAKADYDFYRLLEEQKVVVPKVDAYKSTPKEQVDYQYRLQAASFRSKDDAENLRASLILEGMQAYIQASEAKGNTWYRVFVGPFNNRSTMNKAHDRLVSRGISPMELKQPITPAK